MFAEIDNGRFRIKIAGSVDELTSLQRFRYSIFSREARVRSDSGLDADVYDPFCDHIMVTEKETGRIVGTYRLHPGSRLDASLGFYCENEFHLENLPVEKSRILELGRSCVHPDFRDGSIIGLLWLAITAYLDAGCFDLLMGAVSLPLDQEPLLTPLSAYLAHQAPAPHSYQTLVKRDYRLSEAPLLLPGYKAFGRNADLSMHDHVPPLLKGYLNLGAWVASPPALDAAFGSYDYLVLLHKDNIHPGYLQRFRRQLQRHEAAAGTSRLST